jgi:G:T-mismatch repair DNA endonuclease (very short patch repair protein)
MCAPIALSTCEAVTGTYWDQKIANNKRRDRRTTRTFRRHGWHVVRVWDFDVESSTTSAARFAVRFPRKTSEPGTAAGGRAPPDEDDDGE